MLSEGPTLGTLSEKAQSASLQTVELLKLQEGREIR